MLLKGAVLKNLLKDSYYLIFIGVPKVYQLEMYFVPSLISLPKLCKKKKKENKFYKKRNCVKKKLCKKNCVKKIV